MAHLNFELTRLNPVSHVEVVKCQGAGRDVEADRFGFRREQADTLRKPFSSLMGRVTELTRSRMYIWATSAPSRLPVLVTSTVTVVLSPALIRFLSNRKFLNSNCV